MVCENLQPVTAYRRFEHQAIQGLWCKWNSPSPASPQKEHKENLFSWGVLYSIKKQFIIDATTLRRKVSHHNNSATYSTSSWLFGYAGLEENVQRPELWVYDLEIPAGQCQVAICEF